jgi:alpha-L-fucosidase
MKTISWSRRDMLKATGASLLALSEGSRETSAQIAAQPGPQNAVSLPGDDDRGQRMKWWKAARFGMFVHFGVYSTIARHEWVMEDEGIPVSEYAPHAATFHPQPGSARAWARLAKQRPA